MDQTSSRIELTYETTFGNPTSSAERRRSGCGRVSGDEVLFVYGSLMKPAERQRLLGRAIEARPAQLMGYARGRKRYYFIAKQAGAATDGAILEHLTVHDLAILDEYEQVPTLYTRERIEVLAADGRKIECWIYMPTNWASAA